MTGVRTFPVEIFKFIKSILLENPGHPVLFMESTQAHLILKLVFQSFNYSISFQRKHLNETDGNDFSGWTNVKNYLLNCPNKTAQSF